MPGVEPAGRGGVTAAEGRPRGAAHQRRHPLPPAAERSGRQVPQEAAASVCTLTPGYCWTATPHSSHTGGLPGIRTRGPDPAESGDAGRGRCPAGPEPQAVIAAVPLGEGRRPQSSRRRLHLAEIRHVHPLVHRPARGRGDRRRPSPVRGPSARADARGRGSEGPTRRRSRSSRGPRRQAVHQRVPRRPGDRARPAHRQEARRRRNWTATSASPRRRWTARRFRPG